MNKEIRKLAGQPLRPRPDNDELRSLVDVENGFISRRIFWDDDIYQLELERIFARSWLFVAHESQVRQPGDFLTTYMGWPSFSLSTLATVRAPLSVTPLYACHSMRRRQTPAHQDHSMPSACM